MNYEHIVDNVEAGDAVTGKFDDYLGFIRLI